MFLRALAVLAACAALSACGFSSPFGSSGPGGASLAHLKSIAIRHSSAVHAAAKSVPSGSADFVTAVGGDKTALPIEVRYALRNRPEIGKPVELDIQVTPTGPLGRLLTSFHAEDGLTIERGGTASEADRPEPGVPLSRALEIIARRDGIFYVKATVLVDSGSDSVARTFTIPVIAGAGAS